MDMIHTQQYYVTILQQIKPRRNRLGYYSETFRGFVLKPKHVFNKDRTYEGMRTTDILEELKPRRRYHVPNILLAWGH
jgi:hypothetical protein